MMAARRIRSSFLSEKQFAATLAIVFFNRSTFLRLSHSPHLEHYLLAVRRQPHFVAVV